MIPSCLSQTVAGDRFHLLMLDKDKILSGALPSPHELARWLEVADLTQIVALMKVAIEVRNKTQGNKAELCAIVNARSGRCTEDCAFCAQSIHHQTSIQKYPLLSSEEIIQRAERAASDGVRRFSIVTSGRNCPSGKKLDEICKAIEGMRAKAGVLPCASLGLLNEQQARRLKQAGLVRYHHNIEAGPDFFPRICSTHSFEERMRTIDTARDAGLEVCVGGIVGMGEDLHQRAGLAVALARIAPDSVALNFLNPIEGTPLQNQQFLSVLEALASVAVFRLAVPGAQLRCCGGRTQVLGELSAMMYLAGANAVMTGDYLTTHGASPEEDAAEIRALRLDLVGPDMVQS